MPRRIAPVRPRRKDERAYDAAMRRAILDPLFRDLQSGLANVTAIAQVWQAMDAAVEAARVRGVPIDMIRAALGRIEGYHRARLIASFRAALGIDIKHLLTTPEVEAWMSRTTGENVELIRTIPPRMHESLAASLRRELAEAPFDRQRLRGLLETEYKSSGYNLRRITRDQSTKAIGKLTEIRHRQMQVPGYTWSTAGDEAVRETHRANSGRMFRWDSPPPNGTGHPGADFQCRCVALPALLKKDLDRLGAKAPPAPKPPQRPADKWPAKGTRRRGITAADERRLGSEAETFLAGRPLGEQNAIKAYAHDDFRPINEALRAGRKLPAADQLNIDRINRVIRDAPAPPPPRLVWRGISHRIGTPKVGGGMVLDGLVSTSVDPEVAARFARRGVHQAILEIRPKRGVYIEPVSRFPSEREFLMRDASRYRVAGIDRAPIGKAKAGEDTIRIIQIEEL